VNFPVSFEDGQTFGMSRMSLLLVGDRAGVEMNTLLLRVVEAAL